MKKIITVVIVVTMAALLLAGCAGTDVVLKYSPDSFKKIAEIYPDLVTDNTKTDHYYYLTIDKEITLKISHDYSLTGNDDIMIETPLQPFIDAGLDVSKLVSGEFTAGYKVTDDMLYLTADYGEGTGEKNTVTDALFDSVKYDRTSLTYHQKLDHYGIKLTNGKFEWAKDYTTNDKDIVFVLYAEPLKDLGINVNTIEGWTFMTVEDPDGSGTDVVVKPFNLDLK